MESISFRLPSLKIGSDTVERNKPKCKRWQHHHRNKFITGKEENVIVTEEQEFKFRILVRSQTQQGTHHQVEDERRSLHEDIAYSARHQINRTSLIQKKCLQLRPLTCTDIRSQKYHIPSLCYGCRNNNSLPWIHHRHKDIHRTGGGFEYPSDVVCCHHKRRCHHKPRSLAHPNQRKKKSSEHETRCLKGDLLPNINESKYETHHTFDKYLCKEHKLSSSKKYEKTNDDKQSLNNNNSSSLLQSLHENYSRNSKEDIASLAESDYLTDLDRPITHSYSQDNLTPINTPVSRLDVGYISTDRTSNPDQVTDGHRNEFTIEILGEEHSDLQNSEEIKLPSIQGIESASIFSEDSIDELSFDGSTQSVCTRGDSTTFGEASIDASLNSQELIDTELENDDQSTSDGQVRRNASFTNINHHLLNLSADEVSYPKFSEEVVYPGIFSEEVDYPGIFSEEYSNSGDDVDKPDDNDLFKQLLFGGSQAFTSSDGLLEDPLRILSGKQQEKEHHRKQSYGSCSPRSKRSNLSLPSNFSNESLLFDDGITYDRDNNNDEGNIYDYDGDNTYDFDGDENHTYNGDSSGDIDAYKDLLTNGECIDDFSTPSLPAINLHIADDKTKIEVHSSKIKHNKLPMLNTKHTEGNTHEEKKLLRKPKLNKHFDKNSLLNFMNTQNRPKSSKLEVDDEVDVEDIPMSDFAAQHCIISYKNLRKYEKLFQNNSKNTLNDQPNMSRDKTNSQSMQETESERKEEIYNRNEGNLIQSKSLYKSLEKVGKDFKLAELEFIKRMLQLDDDELDFKTFSIVAALTERITSLDSSIKQYCDELDLRTLERKLDKCKEMYLLLRGKNNSSLREDGESFFPSRDALFTELEAGNITPEDRQSVVEKLYDNENVNFLDFVMYIPLFLTIHERIVNRPIA